MKVDIEMTCNGRCDVKMSFLGINMNTQVISTYEVTPLSPRNLTLWCVIMDDKLSSLFAASVQRNLWSPRGATMVSRPTRVRSCQYTRLSAKTEKPFGKLASDRECRPTKLALHGEASGELDSMYRVKPSTSAMSSSLSNQQLVSNRKQQLTSSPTSCVGVCFVLMQHEWLYIDRAIGFPISRFFISEDPCRII